jgi:hypothetical protein
MHGSYLGWGFALASLQDEGQRPDVDLVDVDLVDVGGGGQLGAVLEG